jgi:trigger factor
MKVTKEDLSSVKKVLHIEIPGDEVTRELDNAYKEVKRTAKVNGFRQGKAPRSILERQFGPDVQADVSSRLIQTSFLEAMKETELNIIAKPTIDPPTPVSGQPFKYDATVEIRPEIADVEYKGLDLKKTKYAVSDGEIEGQLKMLQKNLAEKKTITEERPVKEEDIVLIDYEGFKDDQPFEETQKTENFTLIIGKATISKEFDDAIVGMTAGETKKMTLNFADDYFNDKLAGLEITFEVLLHEIREEILPEINDEMAKKLGQFENLDALKTAIIENLEAGYQKRVEQEMNEQAFGSLIEKTEFELPEVLVDIEMEGILAEAERSFAQHNMTLEQLGMSRETLSQEYRETAEKQARRHLILEKVIQQEGLTVSDEALEKGFEEMAQAYQQPIEGIKSFYNQNADKLEVFKHMLLEKMAIKVIMENSNIEEVEPEAADGDDKAETADKKEKPGTGDSDENAETPEAAE